MRNEKQNREEARRAFCSSLSILSAVETCVTTSGIRSEQSRAQWATSQTLPLSASESQERDSSVKARRNCDEQSTTLVGASRKAIVMEVILNGDERIGTIPNAVAVQK